MRFRLEVVFVFTLKGTYPVQLIFQKLNRLVNLLVTIFDYLFHRQWRLKLRRSAALSAKRSASRWHYGLRGS